MSEHRIIPELRRLRPQIWQTLTAEQRRKALEAANGNCDKASLERAYRIARRAK